MKLLAPFLFGSTLAYTTGTPYDSKIPLTRADFSDHRCWAKSAVTDYVAANAIDGKKYGTRGKYRLAHSYGKASEAVSFTAQFANFYDRYTDVGEVRVWPDELAGWNLLKKFKVYIEDTPCYVLGYAPYIIYTGHVMEAVRGDKPIVFKCPAGTRGAYVRVTNGDYIVMTEIEVWSASAPTTAAPPTTTPPLVPLEAYNTDGLEKQDSPYFAMFNRYQYTRAIQPDKAFDGKLDTNAVAPNIQTVLTGYFRNRSLNINQVHVYPVQDGTAVGFSEDFTIKFGNNECVSNERYTEQEAIDAYVKLGRPFVFICPENSATRNGVRIMNGQDGVTQFAEVEFYV